ncbi:hypothetical protein GNQ08_27790 [Paenibacillus macerans]|uniref:Uncharacterized protein n=1 Tax=Paenibacillus macerans TaxID=44252 RepID=A0A6N8F5T9_PAEMA|nr:hypothetical protein [Paenibacillus macerans]MEC0334166.1 hypothetical protein [Paenibacillus macerans]MED4955890.1 hypothetical protein [Paenibacillus macerans]MUG26168.1 hypothetical protein [Paenibacillus macerans]UMV47116.1 hypothetical protein LMZ02_27255 [Paenibacillus macerans]
MVNKDRYLDLIYQLAIYHFRRKEIAAGLEKLLYALSYAISLNNKEHFFKMVPWFEQHRGQASAQHLKEYETLMREVLKDAEMGSGLRAGH